MLQKRLLSDSEVNDLEKKDVKKKDSMVFYFMMSVCCFNF